MLDEWIRGNKDKDKGGNNPLYSSRGKKYALVIVICLGLLALIWPVTKTESPSPPPAAKSQSTETGKATQGMASELESILSQIDGAGKVEVSLTLTSEGVKTYATNVRTERRVNQESDGRTSKKTTEENQVLDLAVAAGNPLLVEEKIPDILGVLVVADGARNPEVKENLTEATATLLNISAHKVRVLPRKEGS